MIKRIETIEGIGVFYDTQPREHKFLPMTLIYGENGQGKSTLATIFRSLESGDTTIIEEKRTLGGDKEPRVILQFDNGLQVEYGKEKWSANRQEVIVFDKSFTEANVYSGLDIDTKHRKGLLEFALGKSAVTAKNKADLSANNAKEASRRLNTSIAALDMYRKDLPLEDFIALPEIEENTLDEELAELEMGKQGVQEIPKLEKRVLPKEIEYQDLGLASIERIIGLSITGAHDGAMEKVMQNHIKKHKAQDHNEWFATGTLLLADNQTCPYCGQDISSVALIKAYRLYFDEEFQNLQNEVKKLPDMVNDLAGKDRVNTLAKDLQLQMERESNWLDKISLKITSTDLSNLQELFTDLRHSLEHIAKQKIGNPAEEITHTHLDDAKKIENKIQTLLNNINTSLKNSSLQINNFLSHLKKVDLSKINERIEELTATRIRYSADTITALAEMVDAKEKKALADSEKEKSRTALETLMDNTLVKYQEQTNHWLSKFGTKFSIVKIGQDFKGDGKPKASYYLAFKSAFSAKPIEVPLTGKQASFATTLSEGEKHALALAFFLAKVFADPEIATSTIVLDDPMTSFDDIRQTETINSILDLGKEAAQVIVFSHNHYFLRDLKRKYDKAGSPEKGISFYVQQVSDSNSGLNKLDLEEKCESQYMKNYRLISKFVLKSIGEPETVAQAIRIVLEGYLRRRFPGDILEGHSLRDTISKIEAAEIDKPLHSAKDQVQELRDVVDYAHNSHHEKSQRTSDTELKTFCKRTLRLIHGWS